MSSSRDHELTLTGTKAIITGVCGFLGQSLAKQLFSDGADVLGLDIPDRCSVSSPEIEYQQVDILDLERLCDVFTTVRMATAPNIVVLHLAGQSHVGNCRAEPANAFALNVTGTFNVLEACRIAHLKRIVFPSTALVYSLPAQGPLDEDAPLWPKTVYAATKVAAEALIKAYSADYGFACRIARLGNVYGQVQPSDSVVSILLRQVQRGGPISLHSLSPIRDFVYRDDVVRGLVALAAHSGEQGCYVFNLSSGTPTSVHELVLAACRAANLETSVTETAPRALDRNDRLVLSNRRLVEHVRWRPLWSLEDGLRNTLQEMARAES